MKRKGFSLLETLITLGLSLLVIIAAFEFFGITRSLFSKLKDAQEKNQAVQAAVLVWRRRYGRALSKESTSQEPRCSSSAGKRFSPSLRMLPLESKESVSRKLPD
jgi:type II secretory pathway component PulJ